MKTKQAIIEHIKEERDHYWELLKIEEETNGKNGKVYETRLQVECIRRTHYARTMGEWRQSK